MTPEKTKQAMSVVVPESPPTVTDAGRVDLWVNIAICYGANELAAKADTLGEKVFFRLMRDRAEQLVREAGVTIEMNRTGVTLLRLPTGGPPFIEFHERDIELMRACVAEFDGEPARTETMEAEIVRLKAEVERLEKKQCPHDLASAFMKGELADGGA